MSRTVSEGSLGPGGRSPGAGWSALYLLVIALLLGWTAMHLGADPSDGFIPGDTGYRIDEGYKTLSARNAVFHGAAQWHDEDRYRGWTAGSPLTQSLYERSFRAFGVDRTSARGVNVAVFGILLLVGGWLMAWRYGPGVGLAGIVLLGTDAALFRFSRVAIFELWVAAVVALGILFAALVSSRLRGAAPAVLVAFAFFGMEAIKVSTLLYLAPVLLAVVLAEWMRDGDRDSSRGTILAAVVAVGATLVLLYLTSGIWSRRLDLEGLVSNPARVWLNGSNGLAPLAIFAGYLALLDATLRLGLRRAARNPVLLMAGTAIVAVPLILAMFEYHPQRYYLALVPASLILAVEWIHLKWRGALQETYRWSLDRWGALVVILPLVVGSLLAYIGTRMLARLPFLPQGEEPGLSTVGIVSLYPWAILVSALTWALLAKWRPRLLERTVTGAIAVGIGAHLVGSLAMNWEAVRQPEFVTVEIQSRLVSAMTAGETLAGDWAPYFALGTEIPVLYASSVANPPAHLPVLQPDYFLNSHTVADEESLRVLRAEPSITVGSAVPLGEVFGQEIELLRIQY